MSRRRNPNLTLQVGLAGVAIGLVTGALSRLLFGSRSHSAWRSERDIDAAVGTVSKHLDRAASRAKNVAQKGNAEDTTIAIDDAVTDTKQRLGCLATNIKWHMGVAVE
jgi:hypothetical protein